MDSVWDDYEAYPERPGLLASGQEKLLKQVQSDKFRYLYSFKDPVRKVYQVLEIDGRTYAVGETEGIKLFYEYRNPHYFRYFTKINP